MPGDFETVWVPITSGGVVGTADTTKVTADTTKVTADTTKITSATEWVIQDA